MYIFDEELVYNINQPMIDLGNYSSHGLFLNEGIDLARAAMVEDGECARVHGGLLVSTRERMAMAAGCADFVVEYPSKIVESMRNYSWSLMCDHAENIDAIDERKRANVLWLLCKLAFHQYVIELSERCVRLLNEQERPDILCIMGLSNYNFSLDGKITLDTSPFLQAYVESSPGSWASTEASYFLSQINARTTGEVESLSHWLSKHKESIEATDLDDHSIAKLWSRFFRIHAILPQLQGNTDEMVQDMDQAEHWLGQMHQTSIQQRAEYRALRYACYESRIKEALVLGDFELAEQRARHAIACEPSDGRLFMHLGQVLIEKANYLGAVDAYCKSLLLNPTGAEVALFMMGQCYEAMELHWPALQSYRHSLLIDPLSISAREGAIRLANVLGIPNSEIGKQNNLTAREKEAKIYSINAYQQYHGLLGR